MDITLTLSIDESQARAIQLQLLRAGTGETIQELVERLAMKMVNGWAEQNRLEFIDRNLGTIKQVISDLAIDPDRDAKLAAIGMRFENGLFLPL